MRYLCHGAWQLVILRPLQPVTRAKINSKTLSPELTLTYSLQFCAMNCLPLWSSLRRTNFNTRYASIPRLYYSTQQGSSTPRKHCLDVKSVKSKDPSQSPSPLRLPFWTCRSTWRRAGINTLRCLVGCTAGDFSAMWLLQSYYPELGISSIMVASSNSPPPVSPSMHLL